MARYQLNKLCSAARQSSVEHQPAPRGARVVRKGQDKSPNPRKHHRTWSDAHREMQKVARNGLDIGWRRAQLWKLEAQEKKIEEQERTIERQRKQIEAHERRVLEEKLRRRKVQAQKNERRQAQVRSIRTIWVGNVSPRQRVTPFLNW